MKSKGTLLSQFEGRCTITDWEILDFSETKTRDFSNKAIYRFESYVSLFLFYHSGPVHGSTDSIKWQRPFEDANNHSHFFFFTQIVRVNNQLLHWCFVLRFFSLSATQHSFPNTVHAGILMSAAQQVAL